MLNFKREAAECLELSRRLLVLEVPVVSFPASTQSVCSQAGVLSHWVRAIIEVRQGYPTTNNTGAKSGMETSWAEQSSISAM